MMGSFILKVVVEHFPKMSDLLQISPFSFGNIRNWTVEGVALQFPEAPAAGLADLPGQLIASLQSRHFVGENNHTTRGILQALRAYSRLGLTTALHHTIGCGEVLGDGGLGAFSAGHLVGRSHCRSHQQLAGQAGKPIVDICADQQQAAIQGRDDRLCYVVDGIDFVALVGQDVVRTADQANKLHARRAIDYNEGYTLPTPRHFPGILLHPFAKIQ